MLWYIYILYILYILYIYIIYYIYITYIIYIYIIYIIYIYIIYIILYILYICMMFNINHLVVGVFNFDPYPYPDWLWVKPMCSSIHPKKILGPLDVFIVVNSPCWTEIDSSLDFQWPEILATPCHQWGPPSSGPRRLTFQWATGWIVVWCC